MTETPVDLITISNFDDIRIGHGTHEGSDGGGESAAGVSPIPMIDAKYKAGKKKYLLALLSTGKAAWGATHTTLAPIVS